MSVAQVLGMEALQAEVEGAAEGPTTDTRELSLSIHTSTNTAGSRELPELLENAAGDAAIPPAVGRAGPSPGDVSIREDILRGVKVSKMLRHVGMWRESPCDLHPSKQSAYYRFSEAHTEIDKFITHSWTSAWWQKYLTLLIHCFGRQAAIIAACSTVLLLVLDIANVLPTVEMPPGEGVAGFFRYPLEISPWQWVPATVFTVVLFASPFAALALPDTVVFFDQVCIHQADKGLKMAGIYSLPGFLNHSRELVVLLSPETLNRLWCLHEIATFTAAKAKHPTWLPIFTLSMVFAQNLALLPLAILAVARVLAEPDSSFLVTTDFATYAVFLPLLVGFAMMIDLMRKNYRANSDIASKLASFRVDDAECREAEDREYIMQNIEHWYGSKESFNRMVRDTLALEAKLAIQSSDATYPLMFLCVSVMFAQQATFFVACSRAYRSFGLPPELLMAKGVSVMSMSFLVYPSIAKSAWIVSKMFQGRRGNACVDKLVSSLITAACFALALAAISANRHAQHHLLSSCIFAVACGVWTVCSFALGHLRSACLENSPMACA